jgi:hypothetical protein
MATTNRAQRRREQFGKHRAATEPGWPASAPNPVFGDGPAPREGETGRPDEDQTDLTGPGTGGATEDGGRIPRHDGSHAANSAKG